MIRQYLLDLTDGNEETADDFTDQNYADPILLFCRNKELGEVLLTRQPERFCFGIWESRQDMWKDMCLYRRV